MEGQPRVYSRRDFLKLGAGAAAVMALGACSGGKDEPVLPQATHELTEIQTTESTLTPEPIPTIKPTSTPEPTPTPEIEKSPYEFGFTLPAGTSNINLTKDIQTRTKCRDPYDPLGEIDCQATHSFRWNTEKFPDAEQRFIETERYVRYLTYKSEDLSRENVTYEEYLEKVNSGENFLEFTALGYQGDSFLSTQIKVYSQDTFEYDWLGETGGGRSPMGGLDISFRKINAGEKGKFRLQIYAFDGGGNDLESAGQGNPEYNGIIHITDAWGMLIDEKSRKTGDVSHYRGGIVNISNDMIFYRSLLGEPPYQSGILVAE